MKPRRKWKKSEERGRARVRERESARAGSCYNNAENQNAAALARSCARALHTFERCTMSLATQATSTEKHEPVPLAPPLPLPKERFAEGKVRRSAVSRRSHGAWQAPADRPDPVALLEESSKTRIPELVPIRYGRMMKSPFAFLRGSPIVMAHDLARTPVSRMRVPVCGDCHLTNFGVYASPERNLLFDVNDFAETLPGPWEGDVKPPPHSVVV